jgi:hypothetical protein
VGAVEALAGHEAIKVVASPLIAGWSEGKCANGSSGHRVVLFLVGLYVLAIFNAAVLVVVDTEPCDNSARAGCLGNAQLVREPISPKTERNTISMIM